jgi:hypothetical protein
MKMYSGYEHIKQYIMSSNKFISLNEVNDMLGKIWDAAKSPDVDDNYQDIVFEWMKTGYTIDEVIQLAKDSYWECKQKIN